jgi:hypothetical protein
MQMHELLAGARGALGARHEYGEPYEHDGVTVIPASAVRGGGGSGSDAKGGGTGGGFGMTARPAGAWVIKGDEVTWKAAVDPTRIVVGLELVAGIALLRGAGAHRRRRAARPLARMIGRRLPHRTHAHRLQVPKVPKVPFR